MSRSSSKARSVVSVRVTAPPSSRSSINDVRPTSPPQQQSASFFVSLPRLPVERKALYKPAKESSLLPKIDEIVGEFPEHGVNWYFARYKGGMARRYSASYFESLFPTLVEAFKSEKAEGKFKDFDPTNSGIHPLDRVVIKLTIPSRSTSSSLTTLTETSDDEEYEDEDASSVQRPSRRSERNHKGSQQLPFSPRKTRRVILTVTDDDEEGAASGRKTRGLRQLKLKPRAYMDDDYGESEADSDDDEEYGYRSGRSKKGKQRAAPKARGARPEYGTVRPIEEINLDYFSDDEDRSLRAHRGICEKCHHDPAHLQLAAWKKKKGRRKKKATDDEETDEEERIEKSGGWVRCLKCCVSAHWGCMAQTQRDEVLKAIRERESQKWKDEHEDKDPADAPPKRKTLGTEETTDFICGPCSRGGICMGCMETVLRPLGEAPAVPSKDGEDVMMTEATQDSELPIDEASGSTSNKPARELLYRCLTCKRLAHYAHLRRPPSLQDADLSEVAEHYQLNTAWLCPDCTSYQYPLDKIIAWRPYPSNATEPPRPKDEPPSIRDRLPREYLVKWQDRSFRRLSWVPHMWLVNTNFAKLKNFLTGGTKVELLDEPVDDEEKKGEKGAEATFDIGAAAEESRDSSSKPEAVTPKLPSDPLPDAERWIPPRWKTVDRVLDVVLWVPRKSKGASKKQKKAVKGRKQIVSSDEEDDDGDDEEAKEMKRMIFEEGEFPPNNNTKTAEEWEERTGQTISIDEIDKVVWVFVKWDDLGYDEASWDSPPRPGEKGYEAYTGAFERFVFSRTVEIPKLSKAHLKQFDDRVEDEFRKKYMLKDPGDLQLGQAPNLRLMPFQVDGFNWLCNNWWNHQQCILADEMGLGKTVQVTAFLGFIAAQWKAMPALVVVPNSTITNWVREFERWAPNLRVVPYYGEKKARDVIKKFELFHKNPLPANTPAKFHVLVTTYEGITGREFTPIFKNQDRWEALVVDEGQRLKSDSSLLFRKLNELRSNHRVIMTGTPLNNNIRELFNLMNFLDPKEWADLEGLEREYAELDEESIKKLHSRLRPYFLRRIKSEVLQLPAKNEVIVPVSMAPLQKEVYRSILTHNLNLLNGLSQSKHGSASRGKLNNVLMHLRKCLQHPYLYSEDIEPKGLKKQEVHEKLIDGSSKLRLLKMLLPKLKERGHRVLLFSQFVIALDIVEDFLQGEGYKFLRLDGNTKGTERQKGMDEFNKPGSDVFIYLLTTRAGGVGINLFSADTVIIFDPDFNPHQDLQAIARAYRYGQKKTCLVFKLMVKESAEERIMQIGKKKLVLDHLIVQKMDDDEEGTKEDIQSILTYGAQALFDEQNSRDINYSEQDILKLIEKTEVEGDEEEKPKEGMSFSFAKIWAADKDSLEEIEDNDPVDSWAQTLQKIEAERANEVAKTEAVSGRGRRKAAAVAKTKIGTKEIPDGIDAAPPTKPKKGKKASSASEGEGSAYTASVASDGEESAGDSSDAIVRDLMMLGDDDLVEDFEGQQQGGRYDVNNYAPVPTPAPVPKARPPKPVTPVYPECAMCGERHGDGLGACSMTDSSENLAEYREILILHAEDEDWKTRSDAIREIDEILYKRGHLSLIVGQPLNPIRLLPAPTNPVPVRPTLNAVPVQSMAQPLHTNLVRQQVPMQPHQVQQRPIPSSSRPINSNHTSNSVHPPPPIPGPSKRPLPPSGEPVKKKLKLPTDELCAVCLTSPQHLIKDCIVVRQGPRSISQQIERLERTHGMEDTVDILRKILRKLKRREMEMRTQQ